MRASWKAVGLRNCVNPWNVPWCLLFDRGRFRVTSRIASSHRRWSMRWKRAWRIDATPFFSLAWFIAVISCHPTCRRFEKGFLWKFVSYFRISTYTNLSSSNIVRHGFGMIIKLFKIIHKLFLSFLFFWFIAVISNHHVCRRLSPKQYHQNFVIISTTWRINTYPLRFFRFFPLDFFGYLRTIIKLFKVARISLFLFLPR